MVSLSSIVKKLVLSATPGNIGFVDLDLSNEIVPSHELALALVKNTGLRALELQLSISPPEEHGPAHVRMAAAVMTHIADSLAADTALLILRLTVTRGQDIAPLLDALPQTRIAEISISVGLLGDPDILPRIILQCPRLSRVNLESQLSEGPFDEHYYNRMNAVMGLPRTTLIPVMVALRSAQVVKRLGRRAEVRKLPLDLTRMLRSYLY